jgi:hypothetical protein
MRPEDIEPLEPGLWTQRLEQLARWPLGDEAGIERLLRHAFHLVQLAPRPLRHLVHCTCAEAEFEILLEARAFDAAALRLIGHRTPFILKKTAGDEGATAEVWQDDSWGYHGASGPSVALALLLGWVRWISGLGGSEDDAGLWVPGAREAAGQVATEH